MSLLTTAQGDDVRLSSEVPNDDSRRQSFNTRLHHLASYINDNSGRYNGFRQLGIAGAADASCPATRLPRVPMVTFYEKVKISLDSSRIFESPSPFKASY